MTVLRFKAKPRPRPPATSPAVPEFSPTAVIWDVDGEAVSSSGGKLLGWTDGIPRPFPSSALSRGVSMARARFLERAGLTSPRDPPPATTA